MTEVKELLFNLDNLKAHQDYLRLKKQELIDGVITKEIKQQIDDIDVEFMEDFEAIAVSIKEATALVKTAVLEVGETVKGEHLQAVYMKGRSKWDTAGLKGYGVSNPDVMRFFTPGNPSVSIRKV